MYKTGNVHLTLTSYYIGGERVPKDTYIKDLVAEHFLVKPKGKDHIYFVDGNKENNYYVKVYYNGELMTKNIKGIKDNEIIDGKIPYDKFSKLFKSSIDYDYKKLDCSEEKEKKEGDDSLFSIN